MENALNDIGISLVNHFQYCIHPPGLKGGVSLQYHLIQQRPGHKNSWSQFERDGKSLV